MANEVVNRQVIINIVADDVQKAQETLLAKQKKLNEEIKKTNDPKALVELNKQLKVTEQQLERNNKVLKGDLLPTYNQLTAAVRKYYAEFKKTGDPEVLKKYVEANGLLRQMKGEINNLEKANAGLTKGGIFQASFWANLAANGISRVTSMLGNFFRGAIQEALDADEATQRLGSTLDNLGRSDVFDRITRKADEMAKKFRYLDNDDIVGVFNKLIDYGKLTEKEMNKLLPVIIDFAAKSRISLEESTSVIIKALEGNGKALKEYGIELEKGATEADNLQKIMTVLKEKVDGAGEAFQNSAKGGIAVAKQEFANLKEELGDELIPILNKVINLAIKAIKFIKDLPGDIADGFKKGRGAFSFKSTSRIIEELNETEGVKALTAQALEVNQNLRDIIGAGISDAPLGIADKAIGGKKTVKEKKKEVDDMITALQRLNMIRQSLQNSTDGKSEFAKRLEEEAAFLKNAKGFSSRSYGGIDPVTANALFDRSRLAKLELSVLTSRGKARLDAELALLKEQERQELASKENTEAEKLLIEEKYRQMREEAEKNYLLNLISIISEHIQQVLGIYETFAQARTNKENAELDADRKKNDIMQRNLERRLRRGIITQKEYDIQVDLLQRKQEQKEKEYAQRQFRRNQRIAILQTIINGAQGVISTFAARPGLADIFTLATARAIQVGLIVAATAAQVAAITSQKPTFARGGKLGGRLHSEGGNAIVDGRGNKIAEIERGEGIINRHSMADRRTYTFSGTPSQIASRLNGIGGGVQWESPRYMNYRAINKRYYADGGTFNQDANVMTENNEMTRALNLLNYILINKGISVSVDRINEAQDRLANIKSDATLG